MSCELEPSGRRGPDRYNYLFLGSSIPQVVAGDMKPPFPQSMSRGPDCLQPEGNHRNLIVSTRDLIRPGPLLFQFERPGPCKNCPLNPADPRGFKVRVSLADPLRNLLHRHGIDRQGAGTRYPGHPDGSLRISSRVECLKCQTRNGIPGGRCPETLAPSVGRRTERP